MPLSSNPIVRIDPGMDAIDSAFLIHAARASAGVDGEALHARIARVLEEAIRDGHYPVDGALPTEAALCATFDASRFAVRQALQRLVDKGLIERKRGAGSRVVASAPSAQFSQTFRDLDELFQYAKATRLVVTGRDMVRLQPEEAAFVGAPAGSAWLRISGLRKTAEPDATIAAVTVFVHSRFAALLDDVAEATGAIYGLVEARSGETIAEAIQVIAALPMPPEPARILGVRRGTTGMRLVRRYCDASGGTMLASVNWHVGERYTYTMRIRRGDWHG